MKILLPILTLIVLMFLTGCQRANHSDQGKTYDIQGKVTGIEADQKKIKLDHKDIPGFMGAMEMNFNVDDPKLLQGVKVGDQVTGKLKVLGTDYRITELKKQ